VRRIERRTHVRLQDVPRRIERALPSRKNVSDRLLLPRIESELTVQTIHHMARADRLMGRRATAFITHAKRYPGAERYGKQQRSAQPGWQPHVRRLPDC
jgi:hypothetical protein